MLQQRKSIFRNRLIVVVVAIGTLTLLLSGCAPSQLPASSPADQPPAAPPSPVVTLAPTPVPTPTALPARLYLSLSPWPLHGAPPLTADFAARLSGDVWQAGEADRCQSLYWRFGDGTEETQPCPPGEPPWRFESRHTYTRPGTYHACLTLALADGREVESTTQTVVVAVPQPLPGSERFVRWGAWGLSLLGTAGALMWLRRQSGRRKTIGYLLVALGLLTFVPPFSYLPNPAGIYWAWAGGYAYNPRLPFINRFVIAGDPTAHLRPFLDGLIGQTGLDPLHPVQPLAGYEFVKVSLPRPYFGGVQVTTRMTYADGSQRTYDIPLYQPDHSFGFYRGDWRYDGLGRLRTEHREMVGTPFATAAASVRLETPQWLALHPQSHRLNAKDPTNWGPAGFPWQHLVWSPRGDAFLAAQTVTANRIRRDLWLVKLDGSPPARLARNVWNYNWSPDGRYVVFNKYVLPGFGVYVVQRDGQEPRALVEGLECSTFPGLNDEGIWYPWQGDLWLAPYDGSPPRQIAGLPKMEMETLLARRHGQVESLIRPAPEGTRIAYSCGEALCLQDRDGENWRQVEVTPREIAWSPDGSRLAAVYWGYGEDKLATLTVMRRNGEIKYQRTLAPNGAVDAPQWTPDGNWLFVQAFPFHGRRILTMDVATGEVLDLSRPRWDAWFALAPDGRRLLLSNGRGGFWLSELAFTPAEGSS